MNAYWVWVIVSMYAFAAWVATTWIRARYGYPLTSSCGAPMVPTRAADTQALQSDLRARDAEIRGLEKRVQVLERIVTDRAASFEREFEHLAS
jgi:hypothetical protein